MSVSTSPGDTHVDWKCYPYTLTGAIRAASHSAVDDYQPDLAMPPLLVTVVAKRSAMTARGNDDSVGLRSPLRSR